MQMHAVGKVVLILTNFAFIVGGIFLIWLGFMTRDSHWSDIFSTGAPTDIPTTATDLLVLGAVIIVIALFGLVGAVCANRCLLTLYSIFVVLGLIVFVAVGILGFMSASKAHTWTDKSYPADDAEHNVAKAFNQAYCYAEGGRFCVTASIKDAVQTFFPSIGGDVGAAPFKAAGIDVDAKTGLLGLCDQVNAKLASVPSLAKALPKQFKKACAICEDVNETVGEYRSFFNWVDAKCPLTSTTAQWCGTFLLAKSQTSAYESGAPYKHCRRQVLELWKGYGSKVGFGSVVLALLLLFLIGFSCNAAQHNDGYTTII